MRDVVHALTDTELEEITDLFERKIALENLSRIIDCNSPNFESLYARLITDYGKTSRHFEGWWTRMKALYTWDGENFAIDFDNSSVVRVDLQ